jgi:tyrosinase
MVRYLEYKDPWLTFNRRSLSVAQRTNYVKAVKCMMDKPPISKKHFPIVTNRYEDFVALHANATAGGAKLDGPASGFPRMMMGGNNGIHGTGNFLPWHRYELA